MPPGLARLGAHQGLLVGVVGEHLAQAPANRGPHPVNGPAQMRVVGLDVLSRDPAQELAIVRAVGAVAKTDVIDQRGPPDEVHLGSHVFGSHLAFRKIVDQRSHPGLAQIIDHRDHPGQHGKAIATLGERCETKLKINQGAVQQITTGGRAREPVAQPAQVSGQRFIGVRGVVDPVGNLRTSSWPSQLGPGDALFLGDLERRMQVVRGCSGAQQTACLTPQPQPCPRTEPDPVQGAVVLVGGGGHHGGQRHVEHLDPEDLQSGPHLLHKGQIPAPLSRRLGIGQTRFAHRCTELPLGSVQTLAAQTAGDLKRPGRLIRGGDARAIPRVVVGLPCLPGSERGDLGQGLAQLDDPIAADAFEYIAEQSDPRGRRYLARPQLGERNLCVEGADAPRVPPFVQRRTMLHQTVAPVRQCSLDGCGVGVLGILGPVQSGTEPLRESSLVGHPVVGVQDEVAQAKPLEASENRIDGGTLLGHEQRPLALAGKAGDQVGDGLALAGSGWAVDDQVGPAAHGVDDGLLRGVGVQDQVLSGRANVNSRVRDVGADGLERIRVTGQRGDDVMVGQRPKLGGKVGDHRQLRVGERAEHQPGSDLECRDPLAPASQLREHRVGVEVLGEPG